MLFQSFSLTPSENIRILASGGPRDKEKKEKSSELQEGPPLQPSNPLACVHPCLPLRACVQNMGVYPRPMTSLLIQTYAVFVY